MLPRLLLVDVALADVVAVPSSLQQSLLLSVAHPGGRELLSDRKPLLPKEESASLPPSSGSGSSEAALSRLVRAQLLALRQVRLLLRTSHGQMLLAEERARVRSAWDLDIGARSLQHQARARTTLGGRTVRVEAVYALKFAYTLHCEREGMLATELPYFVEYMHKRMLVAFSRRDLDAVRRVVGEVGSTDPRWLSLDDVALLLSDFCGDLTSSCGPGAKVSVRRSSGRDAHCRIRSQARQQARYARLNTHCHYYYHYHCTDIMRIVPAFAVHHSNVCCLVVLLLRRLCWWRSTSSTFRCRRRIIGVPC